MVRFLLQFHCFSFSRLATRWTRPIAKPLKKSLITEISQDGGRSLQDQLLLSCYAVCTGCRCFPPPPPVPSLLSLQMRDVSNPDSPPGFLLLLLLLLWSTPLIWLEMRPLPRLYLQQCVLPQRRADQSAYIKVTAGHILWTSPNTACEQYEGWKFKTKWCSARFGDQYDAW